MPIVVGVNFKKNGKVYYFDPNGIELHEGDYVIAETARGIEFCRVVHEPKDVPEESIVPPLKKIVRKATEEDASREEANEQKAKQAMGICQQKIQNHNLPMKLIDAEYNFECSQITFFFSSESRVDFRELVKDLAGALKTKVQLHQVGVRDEAKFFGGIGPCGRALCCASFLGGFEPVSMKMAKEQSLFLNPLKFSGICGKLMCCLKYEYDMYHDARNRFPPIGAALLTPKGIGHVGEINVVKEIVSVNLEDGTTETYTIDDIKQMGGIKDCAGRCGICLSADDNNDIGDNNPNDIGDSNPSVAMDSTTDKEQRTKIDHQKRPPRKSYTDGKDRPRPAQKRRKQNNNDLDGDV